MKRKLLLMLTMLILGFSITACGKKADGAMPDKLKEEQNLSTTEAVKEIENVEVTKESNGQNSYDTNEMLSDLTIGGVYIGWPCDLEDVQKVFELGNSYCFEDMPDIIWYDLYCDNDKVGEVWINEDNARVVVLRLSYVLNDGIAFEFKGVTENSTYDDAVRVLGEPTNQSEEGYTFIDYYDVEPDRTEAYTYDQISISFRDDNIRSVEFYCSKER